MNKVDYIFLDLDGTLLDMKARLYHCYKNIVLQGKGIPIAIDVYWEMKRNKDSIQSILQMSNYQDTEQIFKDEWMKNIEKKEYLCFDTLKSNVKNILMHWKTFSGKIVLITARNSHGNLIWQLKKLGILELFDEVISCTSYGVNLKYEKLKNKTFKFAVFIGDSEEDMETARKLKAFSIGIISGIRKKEYLQANFYAEEIEDIPIEEVIQRIGLQKV